MKSNGIKQPGNDGLIVFPLSSRLFDVFSGDGWENWARYRKTNTRYYRIGGGLTLDEATLANLVVTHA